MLYEKHGALLSTVLFFFFFFAYILPNLKLIFLIVYKIIILKCFFPFNRVLECCVHQGYY